VLGIGRHIVESEQGGAARAGNGAWLLTRLAEKLTKEFGRGFDVSNLRYMRLLYLAFPIWDALRHELSWTHYRTLLPVENAAAREWYANETVPQNWSSRTRTAGEQTLLRTAAFQQGPPGAAPSRLLFAFLVACGFIAVEEFEFLPGEVLH
jgi:hypothetical protein